MSQLFIIIAIIFIVIVILSRVKSQQEKQLLIEDKSPINPRPHDSDFSDLYSYNFSDDALSSWYECYAAIDFETAMPARNSACAIGIVIFDKQAILHKFYSLIQPPNNEYSIYNTRVHGLNSKDTVKSPTFEQLYPILEQLLPDKKIVAHNASFDVDVFYKSCFYYGIEPFTLNVGLDTYRYYNAKLNDLCVSNNIKLNHHHAGSDAEACALLAMKAFNTINKEVAEIMQRASEITESRAKREKVVKSRPRAQQVFDPSNPFNNKSVVITGTFYNFSDRSKLRDLLSKIGADVCSTVSRKTNILVTGDKPGPSKLSTANEYIKEGLDLMIIDEIDLLKMLAGIVLDEYEDGDFIRYEFIQIQDNSFTIVKGSRINPNSSK